MEDFETWLNVLSKDNKNIKYFEIYGTKAALLWSPGSDIVYVICITSFNKGLPNSNKYDYYGFSLKHWQWDVKAPRGSAEKIKEVLTSIFKTNKPQLKNCKTCSAVIYDEEDTCSFCGAAIIRAKSTIQIEKNIPTKIKPESYEPTKICKYCKTRIPLKATICPNCKKQLKTSIVAQVAAAFFLLMLISMLFGNKSNKTTSSASSEENQHKKNVDKNNVRALAAALTLKRSARNPDSFKLSTAVSMPDGSACFEFRAQNGFGGLNSGHAVLIGQSDNIEINGSPGFSAAWNLECANKSGSDIIDYLEIALK